MHWKKKAMTSHRTPKTSAKLELRSVLELTVTTLILKLILKGAAEIRFTLQHFPIERRPASSIMVAA